MLLLVEEHQANGSWRKRLRIVTVIYAFLRIKVSHQYTSSVRKQFFPNSFKVFTVQERLRIVIYSFAADIRSSV